MLTHTLAAVLLELAYLSAGILLCFMGLRLLEKGVESKMKLEGEIGGSKWALLTSSPGIVFALCGLGIILYAIVTATEYKETLKQSNITQQTAEQAQQQFTQTTIQSRLFEQPSEFAALTSRVAIYALHHRNQQRDEQNVQAAIAKMPTSANTEPWPQTYDRFLDILGKNPAALSKMLNQPEYKWLIARNQRDGTLSALLDIEIERLSAKSSP